MTITYEGPLEPGWIDYNGHLRDAYYALIFSYATDRLMELIGLDAAGRKAQAATLYTLEAHLLYLAEVKGDAAVRVCTTLLAHDAKKIHLLHALHVAGRDGPAAVGEQLLIHIDTASGRSAPMGEGLLAAVRALVAVAGDGAPYAGRAIALRR
ncbi:MAG TPA: thioesterase family protein [Novosphingobium sp.]|nr:thioesterase family protein [Novosphingobium sp.]HZV08928.1 thioesterase family protein [Novosphingobium sp.]